MNKISRFTFDDQQHQLIVNRENQQDAWQFSYEFLRVVNLTGDAKQPLATNQKDARITNIESVGKYGYRFIFNDGHNAVYHDDDLALMHVQHDNLWQQYLNAIKASGLSREATIEIKQL